jgi:hypothetical protein
VGGGTGQVAADVPFSRTKSIIQMAGKDRDTELSQSTTKRSFFMNELWGFGPHIRDKPYRRTTFCLKGENGVEGAWRTMHRGYTTTTCNSSPQWECPTER